MLTTVPKCDTCGRFFKPEEPGSSWAFVPDTPFTYEETALQCARCTDTHGPVLPRQSVDVTMCSGVYGKE